MNMKHHHIDIGSALKQCVSEGFSHLVTRPTGAAVREFIERQLKTVTPAKDVALIDFSHVGMMDFSCADEIVAKLVAHPDAASYQYVFGGLNDMHIEAIDTVLERHGMALAPHETESATYIAVTVH